MRVCQLLINEHVFMYGRGQANCLGNRYITKTKVNSAFHPSEIEKSTVPGCLAGVKVGRVFTSVGWQVTLCDVL